MLRHSRGPFSVHAGYIVSLGCDGVVNRYTLLGRELLRTVLVLAIIRGWPGDFDGRRGRWPREEGGHQESDGATTSRRDRPKLSVSLQCTLLCFYWTSVTLAVACHC